MEPSPVDPYSTPSPVRRLPADVSCSTPPAPMRKRNAEDSYATPPVLMRKRPAEDSYSTPPAAMQKRPAEDSYSTPPAPKKKRPADLSPNELVKKFLNSTDEVYLSTMEKLLALYVIPEGEAAKRQRQMQGDAVQCSPFLLVNAYIQSLYTDSYMGVMVAEDFPLTCTQIFCPFIS